MPRKTEIDTQHEAGLAWRPSAELEILRYRARVVDKIRGYFEQTDALEVSTPLLMPFGSPDPAVVNFAANSPNVTEPGPSGHLQTSPEFAMKRLLAAGSGDIFQLCAAFRAEESGNHHAPEFTILEWYRLGFDHHRLMDDVEALVKLVIPETAFSRLRYAELLSEFAGVDPHRTSTSELELAARVGNIELGASNTDRVILLDALYAQAIASSGASGIAVFVYDFPIEHAAYAKISSSKPPTAERFELLVDGLEIANGYHEVTDVNEQKMRHQTENQRRCELGLPQVAVDPLFIAALEYGLPACAGVALGLERLLMLGAEQVSVAAVSSFSPYA